MQLKVDAKQQQIKELVPSSDDLSTMILPAKYL